jgi:hypothetical protein
MFGGQWLENSLRFSVTQAVAKDPGAAEMLTRLSEVFSSKPYAAFSESCRPDRPDGSPVRAIRP